MALATAIMLSGLSSEQFAEEFENIFNAATLLTHHPDPPPISSSVAEKCSVTPIIPKRVPIYPVIPETGPTEPIIPNKVTSPTDSGISSSSELSTGSRTPSPEFAFERESKSSSKRKSEPTSEFMSEFASGRKLEPNSELTTEAVSEDKSERTPEFTSGPLVLYKPAPSSESSDSALSDEEEIESVESILYYLDVIDRLEQKFMFYDTFTRPKGYIYSSLDPKVMYQKRDILDLASNVQQESPTWDFQHPVLETGVSSFFQNRSQLSRLGGAELPPHKVKRCRVEGCSYDEPVYL